MYIFIQVHQIVALIALAFENWMQHESLRTPLESIYVVLTWNSTLSIHMNIFTTTLEVPDDQSPELSDNVALRKFLCIQNYRTLIPRTVGCYS